MQLQPSRVANFKSAFGNFSIRAYRNSRHTHIALWVGDIANAEALLVRIQSSCITSTAIAGVICDCKTQMDMALASISRAGTGVFVYLDQEGRGLGLWEKVETMHEMNKGADTVTAFTCRGLKADCREYTDVIAILEDLSVPRTLKLATNNPQKIAALNAVGYSVERMPIEAPPTPDTINYIKTKREKLGHLIGNV